jgi:hypothetical protein
LSHIDFHENTGARANLRGGLPQIGDLRRIVDAYTHAGMARQLREKLSFRWPRHLVADVNVVNARHHEGHRLAHLLATDANGAARDLGARYIRAFMRFRVGAKLDACLARPVLHQVEIALEYIEIEHERWGINGLKRLSRQCWRRQDDMVPAVLCYVHFFILSKSS